LFLLISIFLATIFNRGHQDEKRLQDTKIQIMSDGGGENQVDESIVSAIVSAGSKHTFAERGSLLMYMNKK
jgi:hypothetical protein